jgi:tetratricopeptide (TPR) repeat protein
MEVCVDVNDPRAAQLRSLLEELNFDKAAEVADELAKRYFNQSSSSDETTATHPDLKLLLMIIETLFYRGKTNDPFVTKYLRPYAHTLTGIRRFIEETSDIPMRWRLQLGEYVYSRRNLRLATAIADALSEEVHEELSRSPSDSEKRYELGEIEYFRLRIAHRQAQYTEMLNHSLHAITALTAADTADTASSLTFRVRWRLGQVLLVFGTGAWRHGDPGRGEPRLHMARWLLKGIPDHLSNANVQHALGAMYRAQGAYKEAKPYLDAARVQYEALGHSLNRARIHTSCGIYWLSQKELNKASVEFESAMTFADDVKSSKQQAEIHFWQCWLALAHTKPDLDNALTLGKEALKALDKHRDAQEDVYHVRIDAHLALGSVCYKSRRFEQAQKHFDQALKIASNQRLRKHQINAHLSLAELALDFQDTQSAWDHYNAATTRVVSENQYPDSKYLKEKRDRIKRRLEEKNVFYVSYDDFVREGKTLKKYVTGLESWLVDQAEKEVGSKDVNIAKRLAETRQRIAKLRHPTRKRSSSRTEKQLEDPVQEMGPDE